MPKIDPKIGQNWLEKRERLKQGKEFATGVMRVTAQLIEDGHSVAKTIVASERGDGEAAGSSFLQTKEFGFEADECDDDARGPLALQYFLAGYAFCMLSIGAYIASANKLDLDLFELEVRGYTDRKAMMGLSDGIPGFKRWVYEVRVNSKAEQHVVEKWLEQVEAQCPAHNTIRRALPMERTFRFNGSKVGEPLTLSRLV